jgi:hypothetical protein
MEHSHEESWVGPYYETLDFFYWEPQHLGRKKHVGMPSVPLAKVRDCVGRIEVTLNLLLKQFLSLAPRQLRNQLFEKALGHAPVGDFVMAGRDVGSGWKCKVGEHVQPDFFFIGESSSIALEMKIGAKTSLDQVMKYGLLALGLEQAQEKEMKHSLIYLGGRKFFDLWKSDERFDTPEALRNTLANVAFREKSTKFLNGKLLFEGLRERFAEIISSLQIGFLNYNDFAEILGKETQSLDVSVDSRVYQNLIRGMMAELKRRGLLSSQYSTT